MVAEVNWESLLGSEPLLQRSEAELSLARRQRFVLPYEEAQVRMKGVQLFPAVSLEGWIREAEAAGIPHVPVQRVMNFPIDSILSESEDPEVRALFNELAAISGALPHGQMLRMDFCASTALKAAMSAGERVDGDKLEYFPCPRIFDIAYEYPAVFAPVLQRPWVKADMEAGYPVEYRAFIKNGQVIGVANYYIQRALPEDDSIRGDVAIVIERSRALLESMARRKAIPYNHGASASNGFNPEAVSCTMDYIVAEDGQVLFLEAGPPFGLGAHPCAFMAGFPEPQDGSVVHVALGKGDAQ